MNVPTSFYSLLTLAKLRKVVIVTSHRKNTSTTNDAPLKSSVALELALAPRSLLVRLLEKPEIALVA